MISQHCLQGNLTACLETLLSLEKQHRLGEDVTATKICCNAIIETLFLAKEWKLLNEHLLLLAKRRSQLKQVQCKLSWFCYVDAVCCCLDLKPANEQYGQKKSAFR